MTKSEAGRIGGIIAHQIGVAHIFTSEEARAAGIKGGNKTAMKPGHMAKIGSLGGKAPKKKKEEKENGNEKSPK